MGPQTKPRLDRDARREAILDVAAEVFMEEGYAAASMSAIAARLGGSKGTLYNYFKGKEELFAAYVVRHCNWQEAVMFGPLDDDLDVHAALTKVGRAYLSTTLSDFSSRNFRVIAGEVDRAPQMGRAFYEAGPLTGAKRLAAFLHEAAMHGDLRLVDPLAAAHQFLGLCQYRMFKARLCGVMAEPTAEEIDGEVAAAVDTYMAAFGVAAAPPAPR